MSSSAASGGLYAIDPLQSDEKQNAYFKNKKNHYPRAFSVRSLDSMKLPANLWMLGVVNASRLCVHQGIP
jgi:hypothetical protein